MSRLVVVSNRIPLGDSPSGGLVVALQDALRRSRGLWIGFSGAAARKTSTELTFQGAAPFQRAAFDLSPRDYQNYYLGFSNSVLWPAFHDRADLMRIAPEYLEGYRHVNARIAELMLPHLREDDRIWVHDYQLFPLASELRKRGVTARIGFFLHIPFPAPADCSTLPNPAELLDWLSQYDLVGFQADRDKTNLVESASNLGDIKHLGQNRYLLSGCKVKLQVFPIGIDTKAFIAEARDAREEDRMRALTDSLMMIGVDRLDYSKGIPQRFRAFHMMLDTNPDLIEKVAFLQIAPPTREEVAAYRDIREETEHLAGRINGEFATVNWTPIRYIHRAIPRHELAGLYRQAKVGMVTPLADGMNLVAKEYVAAQDLSDPGVLILSRFAGAAETMRDALIINPHDPGELADAMKQAINMSSAERRRRHASLLQGVMEQEVGWWSSTYLSVLGE